MLTTMRTNITRRLAAAVVVPVALVGFAACNDDDNDSKGSDTPDETTSQEATTGEEGDESESSDKGDSSAEEISNDDFAKLVADGTKETTTAKMKMEVTAGGVATTIEGVLDYTGKQPATQMTMNVPGGQGKMDIIMVDGVVYMTMPMQGQSGYMKMDLKANPELAEQMGGLDSFDPSNMTDQLTEGLKDVETVGKEDVDGVEATHYKVTVDTEAASEMLEGMEGAQGQVPDEMVMDIWLDGEGRLIQTEGDLGGQGTMKMNVFDFGADVSIEAPPADEVQDMSEMMSGMGNQ